MLLVLLAARRDSGVRRVNRGLILIKRFKTLN
jgi:hypothetical protein